MQICANVKETFKTRSTEIKKPLVDYQTITDINLEFTRSWLPLAVTETTSKDERNKRKYWQSSNIK